MAKARSHRVSSRGTNLIAIPIPVITSPIATCAAVYGDGAKLTEHEKWLETLKAGGDAGQLGQILQMSTGLVGGIIQGALVGVSKFPPIVAVLGAGSITALGAIVLRRASPQGRESFWSGVGRIAQGFGEVVGEYKRLLDEFRAAAPIIEPWEELAAVSAGGAVLIRASLHTLCRSSHSDRSAAELTRLLPPLGVSQGVGRVRQALRTSPCVQETVIEPDGHQHAGSFVVGADWDGTADLSLQALR